MAQLTTEQWLTNIQSGLIAELTKHKEALPPGFNRERFVLNCITVIQDMLRDSKKKDQLCKVKAETIPVCLAKAAYLGLDFFNGECYAIPYGSNMNFQTDYKGEIKLCKRYSKNAIKDIYAKNVRDGDFFEEEISGGIQNVTFRPVPFSDKPIIGSFAIVVYKDGSMIYDTMSKADIEKVRNTYSKAKDSQAWRESPGEMYKKTVLRRLCKLIDLDFDNIEQQRAFEDGGDAIFENQQIAEGNRAALPDNGAPVDVFAQMPPQREKEPVPAGRYSGDNEDEFRQFEQQYEQPPADSSFMIPDDMPDDLPFR